MSFQAVMEELLPKTNASRTTLRLDDTPGEVDQWQQFDETVASKVQQILASPGA